MNKNIYDYRIVNPMSSSFSAAEARTAWSSIRFNNLTAAELHYPDYVRIMISQDGNTLAIQACKEDTPCAVPFMLGRTADDLRGQKKWLSITNSMLLRIIRDKQRWGDAKTMRRFFGLPWPEQDAILFDLTRIAPPRTRTPYTSSEDMLQTYARAAKAPLMPVAVGATAQPFSQFISDPGQVYDADYQVINS